MMIEVVALEQKIKPKVRKECALFVLLKMMMSMLFLIIYLSILGLGQQQVILEPDEWGKLKAQISSMLREPEEINQNIS